MDPGGGSAPLPCRDLNPSHALPATTLTKLTLRLLAAWVHVPRWVVVGGARAENVVGGHVGVRTQVEPSQGKPAVR